MADHLCVDVKNQRLFTTMQAQKAVVVIDLKQGKVIQNIPVGNPHSCAYRSDLDQIYVNDSDPVQPGVKIFSGKDYKLVKTVQLLHRTDSMGYDTQSKELYVVNGGESEKLDYSLISVVDTTTAQRLGDIRISSETLEDMDLDRIGPRLYISTEDNNHVVVVDRKARKVLATWPVTKGSTPVATAIDEAGHRLFVACRTGDVKGDIVVFDADSGKEITTLPIESWLDYMVYDPATGRIYAVCGLGHTYVYQKKDPDHYVLVQKVDTALLAKTGLLVPELHRFFVVVPMLAWKPAKVLVYQVE